MTSVAQALRAAARILAPTCDTARLDAELLMAHALGVDRAQMLLRHMGAPPPAAFAALIERRRCHEPAAYIVGVQQFRGLDLEVDPAVLIPRGDSETLIEAARIALAGRPPRRVLDLGTGSGALLIAALALWPRATGVGIDASPAALALAERNAARHLAGGWRMLARDWTVAGWSTDLGTFDLILANPPYVEAGADLAASVRDFEPAGALFAGSDGLDSYRALLPQVPALLAPGGLALFEIGAAQAPAVTRLAADHGLAAMLHRDLGGRPRAIALTCAA